MKGDRVTAPDGTEVVLADIGTSLVLERPGVRIWDVALPAGARHDWHLHANPYVVLSLTTCSGRMDWLDGSPSRHIEEYAGGAVFRPISTIHCLTNTGEVPYRNRLIELTDLGEDAPEPVDVGQGGRSDPDADEPVLADGRRLVLATEWVTITRATVPAGGSLELAPAGATTVVALLDASDDGRGTSVHPDGAAPVRIDNTTDEERTWFVVTLDHEQSKELR